jgi:heterodisulfide reductase subunit B
MRYGYYTGCSITSSEQELELSLRNVIKELAIDLKVFETPGCCGCVIRGEEEVGPARELLISEIINTCTDIDTLIVPCTHCYRAIRFATHDMTERIPRVVHPLEFLTRDVSKDTLKFKRVRQIKGLKVTPYYGCVFKPLSEEEEESDNPRYMEELFESLGLETVWTPESKECCGGRQHMDSLEAWGPVNKRIIDTASSWGADVLAVGCTLCHSILEGSVQSDKIVGEDKIIVMYYSQIAGYIMGLDKGLLFLADKNNPLAV